MTKFITPLAISCFLAVSVTACQAAEPQSKPADKDNLALSAVTQAARFNDSDNVLPVSDVADITNQVNIETWIDDLDAPWGITFTAPNTALITQKSGEFFIHQDGTLTEIRNVPEVNDGGQGGLMDVALDPNWPEEDWIYLSFSHPKTSGAKEAMTKIIRAKLRGGALADIETLFQAKDEHYVNRRHHFGSRITFDAAGHLYFSIGDRGIMKDAQDVTKPNGKVHRINRDGSIPGDNPLLDNPDAYPSIYSFGNRNPQGLVIHPDTDVLWSTEHGPKGGDELNVIRPGVNYGWPEISYGINYNGTVLTEFTKKPGMAQPTSQWTPSIAVCGLDVYKGDMFSAWDGALLAGALAYEEIRLIKVDGDNYVSEQIIMQQEGRVRDVTVGPDGAIYAAVEDKILRLTPKE